MNILRNVFIEQEDIYTDFPYFKIIIFNDSIIDYDFSNMALPVKLYKVDGEYDSWVTGLGYFRNLFHNRLKRSLSHIRNGIKDRFPFCCILYFVLEMLLWGTRWLKLIRGRVRDGKKNKYGIVYVPCIFCQEK